MKATDVATYLQVAKNGFDFLRGIMPRKGPQGEAPQGLLEAPDLTGDIQRLRQELVGLTSSESPPEVAVLKNPPPTTTQGPPKSPPTVISPEAAPEVPLIRAGVDAQRLAWQDALIRAELWLLEGHLKNNCIGCGGDVECCLPPGVQIYGKERLYPIERTHYHGNARDRLVFTGEGRLRKAAQYHSHLYDGELVELAFRYTNIPLPLTPNHPILAVKDVRAPQTSWRHRGIDEAQLGWVKAQDISDHDFIAFPRIKETRDIGVITDEVAELLGWYVAEGSPNGNRIEFSLGKGEPEKAKRVRELIEHSFGAAAAITPTATALKVSFHSTLFAPIFKQFGHGARNKKLPSWFLYLPEHKQYSFLRGAIGGDGHPDKFSISYTTCSETLAYQLRLLLFRLGLLHNLSERSVPDSIIDGRTVHANGDRYDLLIAGDAARSLAEKIGVKYDGGKRTSGNYGWVGDNYVFIPVKAIKAIPYRGRVYNLGVEEDESYLTVHGILHNCWKHSTNIIDASRETQSMTTEEVYAQAAALGEHIRPLVHPDDVRAGKYANIYASLAVEVSGLRTKFDARVLAKAPPAMSLEEAKAEAARAAAEEIERRWGSSGNPQTYGPPETAPPEVKAIWDRALRQAQQKHPLGSPALVEEAKRAGVSEAETQQMIAHEEYILERRRLSETGTPKPTVDDGPVAKLAKKWATAKRNSALALRDLETISDRYDTSGCKEALREYTDLERADYEDPEEYQEARTEAWDQFVECLETLAGEEEQGE